MCMKNEPTSYTRMLLNFRFTVVKPVDTKLFVNIGDGEGNDLTDLLLGQIISLTVNGVEIPSRMFLKIILL